MRMRVMRKPQREEQQDAVTAERERTFAVVVGVEQEDCQEGEETKCI